MQAPAKAEPDDFGVPGSELPEPHQAELDAPAKPEVNDIGHAETLLDSSESAPDKPWEEPSGADDQSQHDGLFSTPSDSGDDSEWPYPSPGGTSLDGIPDEPKSEDAVPFFPDAPKLGDGAESPTEQSSSSLEEMTGSLLIQINEIKSDGRKRAVLAGVGARAAIALLGAVVAVGWSQLGVEDDEVEEERVRMDHVGAEPVFREYTADELARISETMVLEEELVVSREDGRAAVEREERRERGGSQGGTETDESPRMPSVNPDSFRHEARADEPEADRVEEEAGASGSRFARPEFGGSGPSEEAGMASADDGDDGAEEDSEVDSRFEAMAALHSDTERGIHGADDNPDLGRQMQDGLSGDDIARGIQSVMESVGICRERHIYRGGTLEEDQLRVSLTVLPDGDVGQFKMEPGTLADTDFGRCMQSHTGRWPFPRFRGDPVEIQAPFALQ